jgi:hypothetical protein
MQSMTIRPRDAAPRRARLTRARGAEKIRENAQCIRAFSRTDRPPPSAGAAATPAERGSARSRPRAAATTAAARTWRNRGKSARAAVPKKIAYLPGIRARFCPRAPPGARAHRARRRFQRARTGRKKLRNRSEAAIVVNHPEPRKEHPMAAAATKSKSAKKPVKKAAAKPAAKKAVKKTAKK